VKDRTGEEPEPKRTPQKQDEARKQRERGRGGEKTDLEQEIRTIEEKTWGLTEDLPDPDPPTSRTPRFEQIWKRNLLTT
jgi:hypothetical protein